MIQIPSLAIVINLGVTALCLAVLVQSVRLMRAMRVLRGDGLPAMIGSLDRSCIEARRVLSSLQSALGTAAERATTLESGREIAEELNVMIGIANASAERLLAAGMKQREAQPAPAAPVAPLDRPEVCDL